MKPYKSYVMSVDNYGYARLSDGTRLWWSMDVDLPDDYQWCQWDVRRKSLRACKRFLRKHCGTLPDDVVVTLEIYDYRRRVVVSCHDKLRAIRKR